MKYTLKKKPTPYDISLAGVKTVDIRGGRIMHINDMSAQVDNNSYAAFQNLKSIPDSTNSNSVLRHKLIGSNVFSDLIITDEFCYDSTVSSSVPLWYKHNLNSILCSSNVSSRELRRKIRTDKIQSDRHIYGLIPAGSGYIIPYGTVQVTAVKTGGNTDLTSDEYTVNHTAGKVSILSSSLTGVSSVIVKYKLLPGEIIIDEYGSNYMGIMAYPADTSYSYYNVSILSNTKDSFTVRYMSKTGETVAEVTERTSYTNLFTAVESISDVINNPAKKVFYYSDEDIYVPSTNQDHVYCFMPENVRNGKISIVKPVDSSYLSPWNPIVTNGKAESDSGVFTSESSKYSYHIKERARVVSESTISVSSKGIRFSMSISGISGIKITRESDGVEIPVSAVNSFTGTIELSQKISRRDVFYVSYSIPSYGKEIILSANPMDFYSSIGFDSKYYGVVICTIDDRMNPPGRRTKMYYKPVRLFYSGRPIVYTYDSVNSSLNGSDVTERNLYRYEMDLPPLFYSTTTLYRVEPLAILSIASIFDSDAFEVDDIRTFGGGTDSPHSSFYDHSYYDGERTDLSSKLRVVIPAWIKDNLKARCKQWSPDAAKSDYPDDVASVEAENILRAKVRKFALIGTEQEVVFGE